MDYPNQPKTFAFTIPANSTVRQLRERIADKTSRQPEWFDIEIGFTKILPTDNLDVPLTDFKFSTEDPNVLSLTATQAYKDAKKENPLLGAEEDDYRGYSGYPSYGYTNWYTKSSTGYVGLSNQGATCYLNRCSNSDL